MAEEQDVPCSVTSGSSTDKRPARKPLVRSMLCVDRAVPIGGKPEDGHASDTTLQTTLLSEIAPLLARHGGPPGASLDMADAALVTADHLAARGASVCITR